jgi:multiple sugar transport system substrate-binding protein
MLKRALIAVIAVGLVFTGCQKKGADTAAAAAPDKAEPKTVSFSTWGVVESPLQAYFDYVKENFEAENPDIEIEWVGIPYNNMKQQTLILGAAGDLPDGNQSARPWYNSYAPTGYFADATAVMGDAYMNDLLPGLKEELVYDDGSIYAVPWKVCSFTMAWNKELFERAGLDPETPPATYEQIMEYSARLSQLKDADGNQVFGFSHPGSSNTASGDYILSQIWSFGGDPWDASTKDNIVSAFDYLKTMYDKEFTPGVQDFKDNRNMFALGRLAMYYDHIWGVGNAWKLDPGIKSKTGLMGPVGSDTGIASSTMEGHLILINEDSENKAETAKLIEFMTGADSMKIYRDIQPFYLVRQAQLDATPEYKNDPMLAKVANWSESIRPLPVRDETEQVVMELTSLYQGVLTDVMTPDQAADSILKLVKEIW